MLRVENPRKIIDRKALARRLDQLAAEKKGQAKKAQAQKDKAGKGKAGKGKDAGAGLAPACRAEALGLFKDALARGYAEVRRRFEDEALPGDDAIAQNAFLIDQIVRALYDFAESCAVPARGGILKKPQTLSVLATGGYGRGELAPFSDIDLMFLLSSKETKRTKDVVEFMLYMLWDLGLKVGHATRTIKDSIRLAREDVTIRTSLLEARWLWGDEDLFTKFRSSFMKDVVADSGPEYVRAKLEERDDRHRRMGESRYVLEPNVKEGKGGLRDLQTLFWIAKYLYQADTADELVAKKVLTKSDAARFKKAHNFLWTVRCHLHYLTGRPDERLVFNVQTEIAKRMRYRARAGLSGVERFMKHYFLVAKDVGDLTRILCAVLEEEHKKTSTLSRLPSRARAERIIEGFAVDGFRLTVTDTALFKNDPAAMLRLFHTAQAETMDIHPKALRLVTQNLKRIDDDVREDAEANRLFMDMLTSKKDPATTLMRMNEAGLFGRFMPDFGRVVAQMQYDMYHVYTVDEHTIRAIDILSRIEAGALAKDHPVSSSVVGELQSRRVLYVAVLLHDIAKGRKGDHSEVGAEIALELCPRLGLNEWETETVAWLVRHHLDMSRAAFKRDLDDEKTIEDFVQVVQSPERLRLLLILTVCDIRAVGPGVWNGWKAALLRELYYAALAAITGDLPAERRQARVKDATEALRERLADWDRADLDAHIARGYPDYWLSFDAETLARHAEMVRGAEAEGLDLCTQVRADVERDSTELLIYTPDHPGLFSRIAGALSLMDASIVDARIVTLSNGMALDTFWIQNADGSQIEGAERFRRLETRIEDALRGKTSPKRELAARRDAALPSRTRVFTVPPKVLVDNKASATCTVLELNGRDRPGFLHDITAAITGLGLQIMSAHISTYGERVVDVFYVKDAFGLKVENEDRIERMRQAIFEVISSGAAANEGDDASNTKAKARVTA